LYDPVNLMAASKILLSALLRWSHDFYLFFRFRWLLLCVIVIS
jgi:hypothetical protein